MGRKAFETPECGFVHATVRQGLWVPVCSLGYMPRKVGDAIR